MKQIQNRTGSFWPNPTQELLLQSAFLKPKEALQAWEKWKEKSDIFDLDAASYRLMPQVYYRLKDSHLEEVYHNKMKGIYRHTWAKNQHLFQAMRPILEDLNHAKIPILLLKGAALSLSHFQDFGLRPMQDFDLLVPESSALKALAILQSHGWRPKYLKYQTVQRFNPVFLRVYPAMNLEGKEKAECDLHWRALCWENRKQGIENDLWEKGVPASWKGISLLIPSATDQLFHVIIHGTEYSDIPSIRWASDAMMIFQSGQTIDWERLLSLGKRHSHTLALCETMHYLSEVLYAPIPSTFLHRLKQSTISNKERTEYEQRTSRTPSRTIKQQWKQNLAFLWNSHKNVFRRRDASTLHLVATFPEFLTQLWGLFSLFQLPFHILWLQLKFLKKSAFRNALQIKNKP